MYRGDLNVPAVRCTWRGTLCSENRRYADRGYSTGCSLASAFDAGATPRAQVKRRNCPLRSLRLELGQAGCAGGVVHLAALCSRASHMLLQVEVPAGLIAGDPFTVEAGGQCFEVCVPDGVGAGELIEVDLPIDEQPPEGQTNEPLLVDIAVPDGTGPGSEVNVEAEGQVFTVIIPDGLQPGDIFTVEVPRAETPSTTPARSRRPRAHSRLLSNAEGSDADSPTGGIAVVARRYLEACERAGKVRGSAGVGPYPFYSGGTFDLMQSVEGAPRPATHL
jgi:hypothetical protein